MRKFLFFIPILTSSMLFAEAKASGLRQYCSSNVKPASITRICLGLGDSLKTVVFVNQSRNSFVVIKSEYKGTSGFNGEPYGDPDLGGISYYDLTLKPADGSATGLLKASYLETYTRGPSAPVEITGNGFQADHFKLVR